MRDAILAAAVGSFASHGFARATLADVVARAGTSIGNLYRYFASKEELFEAAFPASFALEFTRLARGSIEALTPEAARELQAFAVSNRARVVFLLLRAQGSVYANVVADLRAALVERALTHAAGRHPDFVMTEATERAVLRLCAAFVVTLGQLFEEERSESALREAVVLHGRYHRAGLTALFAH